MSIPSVTAGVLYELSFINACNSEVLPASPKPTFCYYYLKIHKFNEYNKYLKKNFITSISFVFLHKTDPKRSRLRNESIDVRPLFTISGGGVFNDMQPVSSSFFSGSVLNLPLILSSRIQLVKYSLLRFFRLSISSGTIFMDWCDRFNRVKFVRENMTDGNSLRRSNFLNMNALKLVTF